jgi:aryl-alcohol dehydrogenase-like predicted oxidoreductase
VQYRTLGRTDLKVDPLCLGGNVFGWTTDEGTSFAVLDAYFAAGGNFIDTADVYSSWVPGHSGGESESMLGRWMHERRNRDRVIIATKIGSQMNNDPKMQGLTGRYIKQEVEASLRRLQTDYIDLYLAHRDDSNTSLYETMDAFNDLVKAGKVRYLGASNYSAQRLKEALDVSARNGLARYEALQPPYNLVNREDYERGLEPLCREQQLGVFVYSSLASGFLTGKYHKGQELPDTPRAQGIQNRYMNERGFRILQEVEEVATGYRATPSQVALAWILARPGVTGPIASATSVDQLYELLGALDLELDQDTIAQLDRVSAWQNAQV